jgi:hypothetical protein
VWLDQLHSQNYWINMKKLILAISMLVTTSAYAEPQEHPPLGDIPPSYDMPRDQFTVPYPLVCTGKKENVLKNLNSLGYSLVFLGETVSVVNTPLFAAVFLRQPGEQYFILLMNDEGICELATGEVGNYFPPRPSL